MLVEASGDVALAAEKAFALYVVGCISVPPLISFRRLKLPPPTLNFQSVLTTEIEQRVCWLMLSRDRVEHTANERAVLGGTRFVGSPGRPEVAGEADHLPADRLVFPLGGFEDVVGGQ